MVIKSINKIKIIGERSSGSTYLYYLIEKNFKNIKMLPDVHPPTILDYKHFTLDFDSSYSADTLVICIVRNPYDWLRSLHKTPHHMPFFHKVDFETFLTKPCPSYGGEHWDRYFWDDENARLQCADENYLLETYPNVLEMRKHKLNKYFDSTFPNLEIISYDQLIGNLEQLNIIAKKYNIKTISNSIINLTTIQGYKNNPKYIPTTYPMIEPELLKFINDNLDWDMENKLGFTKNNI